MIENLIYTKNEKLSPIVDNIAPLCEIYDFYDICNILNTKGFVDYTDILNNNYEILARVYNVDNNHYYYINDTLSDVDEVLIIDYITKFVNSEIHSTININNNIEYNYPESPISIYMYVYKNDKLEFKIGLQ